MSSGKWTEQFDPYDFEEFVAGLWEANGYTTHVRKGSGDRGIDVEATKENKKELIQVKLYSPGNKIGAPDVRKYATLYQQVPEADEVVIVTSSSFTSEAKRLGEDLDVLLIDGQTLGEMSAQMDISSYDNSVETTSNTEVNSSTNPVATAVGIIYFILQLGVILLILIFGLGMAVAVF